MFRCILDELPDDFIGIDEDVSGFVERIEKKRHDPLAQEHRPHLVECLTQRGAREFQFPWFTTQECSLDDAGIYRLARPSR